MKHFNCIALGLGLASRRVDDTNPAVAALFGGAGGRGTFKRDYTTSADSAFPQR